MHRGFFDKRRRFLNFRTAQVNNVLPEHFIEFYPKFINLLKTYYDWQEEYSSTELIAHLFATRDINETDITLLSYIEDELLLGEAYFEGFGETEAEKRAAANFSSVLFRSKGSKFAIEWFFRSFYGLDAEVLYPKENVFIVGDTSSQLGADSLRFITNDKLYQTFALLIRVGIPISKWRDMYKLFAHPAGMYLGAEITINDAVTAAISPFGTTDSDVVTTRIAPTYSLLSLVDGANLDSVDEGKNVEWVFSATNIPDNIGAAYWYVTNVSPTLDSSEFFDSANIPRIGSPAYLALNDSAGVAAGRFNIRVLNDADETEGDEQYKVSVTNNIGTILAEKIMTVNDVIPTYSLTSNLGTTVFEGDSVQFTITGTNVPNDGNVTLYWFLQGPNATYVMTDDDFAVTPPRTGTRQAVTLVNSTATFSLKPIIDDATDGGEQFRVQLRKEASGAGTNLAALNITVTDVPYSLSVSAPDITEGNNLVVTITVGSGTVGDVISWQITGDTSSLARLESTSGSVVMTSTSVNVTIATTADDTYYTSPANTLTFTATSPGGGTTANDTFVITDLAAEYEITASPINATEGDSVTFTIGGSNIPDGNVYFFITYDQTTSADFIVVPPLSTSRETVVISGGSGSATAITFASNGDTLDEKFTVYAYDAPTGGNLLASLEYVIIGETYTLTASSASINEGQSVTFTLTTGTDGTYYYWLSGVSASDISSGYAASTTTYPRLPFTVTGGTGSFTITSSADGLLEGNETITAFVSASGTIGAATLTSTTVTLVDTSTPTYSVNAPDVVEGASFVPTVTRASGTGSETVYINLVGAAASKFGVTSTTKTFTSLTTLNVTEFGNPSYSATYQGTLSGTIEVRRGSSIGTLIASDAFNVTDAAATYSLIADDDTPNEGSTITFNLTGTNIPNGTYYWRVSGVNAVQTDQTSASGQARLYVASTSGLAVGMSSNSGSVPGTILSINTNDYVTMSTNITSSVSSGTIVHFAQPSTWSDFSSTSQAHGAFTVTSNAGSFTSTLATDADTSNDVYTYTVYNAQYAGTALVSEVITIQDTTPTNIVSLPADITYSQFRYNAEYAVAGLRFHTDGRITRSPDTATLVNYDLDVIEVGTWVTSTVGLVATNYSIRFVGTRVSYSTPIGTSYFPLSSGYWTADKTVNDDYPSYTEMGTIYTNRDLGVEVSTISSAYVEATYQITIEVYETANPSNSDTMTITVTAGAESYSGSGSDRSR